MRTLEVTLALVSAAASSIAAVFAALAYFHQVFVGRKEVKFLIEFRRDHSHVSITATNVGCTITVLRVSVVTSDGKRLCTDSVTDRFEHGAIVACLNLDAATAKDIPVDVQLRTVVELTDGGSLRSRTFNLSEMIHREDVFRICVSATDAN